MALTRPSTPLQAAHLFDTAANLTSAMLTAASPAIWQALGLPEWARKPSAAALLASGLFHATGRPGGAPINAAWVVAGLSAQALPLKGWQRAVLGVVAAYDVAQTGAKLAADRSRPVPHVSSTSE